MRTYKDDDLYYGDDMVAPDVHGNPVRLSRDAFNRIMESTLRAMGIKTQSKYGIIDLSRMMNMAG